MRKIIVLFLFSGFFASSAQNKIHPDSISSKMQWFADAKLGIFIHWGIYAVNGVDESWSFFNKKISHAAYIQQLKGFTASRYQPQQWARLIKESGARYAVITTKHHDGVALWNTGENHFSIPKNTPAKRDVLDPFYRALRLHGIKTGAYFSLIDWSHPDYPGFIKDSNRYAPATDTARWKRFRQFYMAQLNEVKHLYNPDLWWFDGDWEHSAEEWDAPAIRKILLEKNPQAIINGRLQGYGDYDTPEQNIPVTRPPYRWWELCMTTNNNWGYHPDDSAWKTPYHIISIFADVISNGGNLLLDIGPAEDGTIPAEQVNILKALGRWTKLHSEAIFNTCAGLPPGHFYGPSTLSKDSTSLYLFVPGNASGQVAIRGLKNNIESITALGSRTTLRYEIVGKISWSEVPGLVYINIPPKALDKDMTVLKVKLKDPLRLYRGQGGFQ
jgi:alpha-L-fucosidase